MTFRLVRLLLQVRLGKEWLPSVATKGIRDGFQVMPLRAYSVMQGKCLLCENIEMEGGLICVHIMYYWNETTCTITPDNIAVNVTR